jgi:hypothetical protein
MKALLITVFVLICIHVPVQAMQTLSAGMIKEAQVYGIEYSKGPAADFLFPWMAYEERMRRINERTERVYLYTPYLLVAANARESSLKGLAPRLADAEKILSDYAGFLTFEAILYGTSVDAGDQAKAVLKQGKKTVKHYQLRVSSELEEIDAVKGSALYRNRFYVYFSDREFNLSKPVKLIITTGDKKEHHFTFDLSKLK